MKNGIVISDSGPIFSLAIVDKLEILTAIFDKIYIPKAVWIEITRDETPEHYPRIVHFFKDKVEEISGFNDLTFVMDFGESESVILYRELQADFLLIDDKKARTFAENSGIQCVGTIGILSIAKQKGIIEALKPIFQAFLKNKRYYSLKLLNMVLEQHNESSIES